MIAYCGSTPHDATNQPKGTTQTKMETLKMITVIENCNRGYYIVNVTTPSGATFNKMVVFGTTLAEYVLAFICGDRGWKTAGRKLVNAIVNNTK